MYHASPSAHALSREPFNSWLFQSAALQLYFTLNTNATALLESMLWAVHTLAAAFLRRSSKGFDTDFKRPTHCAYFHQTRPLAINSDPSLSGQWASGTSATTNWHYRASKMTLNVCLLFMMDEIVLLLSCFYFVMFSSEVIWWLHDGNGKRLQSATLFALLFFASFRNDDKR